MDRRSRRTAELLALGALAIGLTTGCAAPQAPPDAPASDLPRGNEEVTLDPADFTTTIDNPFWPMVPGTQWTYLETGADGTEFTNVVTVTSETKVTANGITARVVRDSVIRGDEVVEDTFDWYAQDAHGAIWYLGEETAEFENGVVVSRQGSFEAGVDGALAGIVVPADPRPGMQYRQEYYRGEAEDNGEIVALEEMVDTPYGHFDRVLLTKDTITIEPDVLEHKFYAPGVGPVMALTISGDETGGREVLISINTVPDGTGTGPLGQPQ